MSNRIGLFVAVAGAVAAIAFGQENRVDPPSTPAGVELVALLGLWESDQGAQQYIETRFSPRMLEAYPLRQHVDLFRQISQMHGGFWLEAVDEKSEYELSFLGRSRKRANSWRRLMLKLENEPPHRVDSISIEQAQPPQIQASAPEQRGQTKALTEAAVLEHAAEELDRLSQADEFSGAVLIAKNGETLFRRAYGQASKRFSVPNTPETKFNIGSINKSFTKLGHRSASHRAKDRPRRQGR